MSISLLQNKIDFYMIAMKTRKYGKTKSNWAFPTDPSRDSRTVGWRRDERGELKAVPKRSDEMQQSNQSRG